VNIYYAGQIFQGNFEVESLYISAKHVVRSFIGKQKLIGVGTIALMRANMKKSQNQRNSPGNK